MRQLTRKRLTAWLLTLVMALSLLPAAALADEADDGLSPPAPQEDYGYVRLVFSEGEQLDLHHGEYITECSPTAEVFGNASEDFIIDGEYAALYYEGRLYHKAALDGVSINADAVFPAEDFALVPMGELAAQAPPLGAEQVALTVEGTNEGTTEGTTGGTNKQQETLPSPPPSPPPTLVRKAPRLAAATGGYVDLQLRTTAGTTSKKLYDRQFIKVGTYDATVGTDNDSHTVLNSNEYVAYYINGTLYLNGDMSRMLIDITNAQQRSDGTVLIQVENNVTLSEDNCFIRTGNGRKLWIDISTGKTLTLNADNRYWQTSSAIYAGNNDDVLITGGGELRINCKGNATSERNLTMRGIEARNVTISNATGVYINMTNDTDNTKSDKLCGITADKLTVQDGGYLKIEVTGRKLEKGESRENVAIKANRLVLRDSASVDIISHKNVISDVVLTGTGEVLKMDIDGGRFHITNEGNINRYADEANHRLNDHPFFNIYVENAGNGATVNLTGVGDEGFLIDSYSLVVGNWSSEWKPTNEPNWNWAIGKSPKTAFTPTLGSGVYQGNRRLGGEITNSTHKTYTWGSMEYLSPANGVWTVKYTDGQTYPDTAQNYDTTLNDTYVVAKEWDGKGRLPGSANITAPNDEKSTFIYWYDALHPEDGTWTARTWDYDITKDRLLVPVYGLMKNEPVLSELKTYNQYSYKELTFTTKDSFASACYIVKGLPKQGVGIETVADLKSGTKLFNSGQKLFADKNASHSSGSSARIPEGTYRLAYYTNSRWYFSEEFELKLPLAKPVVKPESEVLQSPGKVPVQIHAERGDVSYRYWDYSTNNWSTSWNSYTGTFDADVTVDRDTRIQIKLRQENTVWGTPWETTTEVRYGVCPSINPTVNYKDTALTNHSDYHYYGSIELTVDVPEGLELYYSTDGAPYVDHNGVLHGTKAENGKVIINGSQEPERYSFRFCKTFTADGQTYCGMCGEYTTFLFTKLDTLPAPEVTVRPKSGGEPLTPSGPNTYTIKEFVNVALAKPSGWPLNATMAYAYNSSTSPQNAVPYTVPFEVRGEKTISVFTRVPKAGGGYDYERENYTFKVDSSVKYVMLIVRNATAYDSNGKVLVTESNGVNTSVNVQVGARIKVVPNAPSGKIFKSWSANGIYDTPNDKFKEELFFTMPDLTSNMLVLVPEFADQSEAYITADTKVLLVMGQKMYNGNDVFMQGTVGDSVDLFINQSEGVDYHALRTISYQWWEGESVGTVDNALPTWATFDKSKTYAVKVTITANKGTKFADYAGVQFGTYGSFLKMKDVTRSSGGKSLTFTATPLREMNLTLPTLHEGDSLSKVQESFNTQLSPMGYEVEQLTWESGTPAIAGSAGTNYRINTLKLKLKQNCPLRDNKVVIDGTYCFHKSDSNGSLVVLDGSKKITVIVKSKGVSVSGTVKSYGDTGENVTVTLTPASGTPLTTTVTGNSATYSFATVPAGTYTLKVEKKGHAPFTKEITVGDSNVTEDVTIYLIGDVNKDGKIDANDMQRVYAHISGENKFSNLAQGDVNGDGKVDANDMQRIYAHISGENPLS